MPTAQSKAVKALAVPELNAINGSKTDLRIQVVGAALDKGDLMSLSASNGRQSFKWTASEFGSPVLVEDPKAQDKNPHYVQTVTITCIEGNDPSGGTNKKLRGEDDLVVVNVTVTSGGNSNTTSGVAALLP